MRTFRRRFIPNGPNRENQPDSEMTLGPRRRDCGATSSYLILKRLAGDEAHTAKADPARIFSMASDSSRILGCRLIVREATQATKNGSCKCNRTPRLQIGKNQAGNSVSTKAVY